MVGSFLIDGKLPKKIFNNNGYRYAVTRTSVHKADGKYNHPQRSWGTIDDKWRGTERVAMRQTM